MKCSAPHLEGSVCLTRRRSGILGAWGQPWEGPPDSHPSHPGDKNPALCQPRSPVPWVLALALLLY